MEEPSVGEKIGLVVLLLVVIGAVLFLIGSCIMTNTKRNDAKDACWECGWGRIEYVDNGYFCVGWEDGAEVARPLEWVQENACQ